MPPNAITNSQEPNGINYKNITLFTMFTIQQHQKPSTSTNTNPKNKTKQQKIKIKPNFINSPITIRANKKNQIYRIWGYRKNYLQDQD
jgi:hypothetical protein